MVLNMMDPQIERKLIEIMRVIHESDKPIGARAIADELNNRGYDIGERAVRYHLRILDEEGSQVNMDMQDVHLLNLGKGR